MRLPRITVNSNRRIVERRMLPAPGEILVKRGQTVQARQVVARAEIPERYYVVNVARRLAQPDVDMSQVMHKEEGEAVEANETIAVLKRRFSFLQKSIQAPVAGHITRIGPGWVLLESERTITELQAFVNGVVTGVISGRGVIIEAQGAIIEAACGFGGEIYGRLKRLVDSPFDYIDESALDDNVEQSIIVGGRSVDEDLLRLAEEKRVAGLIVGSIDIALLNLDPAPQVCVVATEGFGDAPISPYTFGHLTTLSGREVSIRGQTPALLAPASQREAPPAASVILATGQRSTPVEDSGTDQVEEVFVGSRVRITRGQFFGAVGEVHTIPPEPQAIEIGLKAPGAYVSIEGKSHYIPWVNLEGVG